MYYDERSAERVSAALEAVNAQDIWLPDNVSVQFLFSAHRTGEDLGDPDRLRSLMRANDILLREQVLWVDDSPEEKDTNKTARGDQKAYERLRLFKQSIGDSYGQVMLKAMFGTNIVVSSVDIGARNPMTPYAHRLMHIEDGLTQETYVPISHDPDESANHSLSIINDFSLSQRYRERFMLADLGPQLEKVLERNPKLNRKDQVNVLFEMGAIHTNLFHVLRKTVGDSRVTRSFTEQPVWADEKQVLRAKLLRVELSPEVEREMILRGYMTSTALALAQEHGLLTGLSDYQQSRLGRFASRDYSLSELEAFVIINAQQKPDEVTRLHQELIDKVRLAKEVQLG